MTPLLMAALAGGALLLARKPGAKLGSSEPVGSAAAGAPGAPVGKMSDGVAVGLGVYQKANEFISKTPLAPIAWVGTVGARIFAPLTSMKIGGKTTTQMLTDLDRQYWQAMLDGRVTTDENGNALSAQTIADRKAYARSLGLVPGR